jgi:hypothetical protein
MVRQALEPDRKPLKAKLKAKATMKMSLKANFTRRETPVNVE